MWQTLDTSQLMHAYICLKTYGRIYVVYILVYTNIFYLYMIHRHKVTRINLWLCVYDISLRHDTGIMYHIHVISRLLI